MKDNISVPPRVRQHNLHIDRDSAIALDAVVEVVLDKGLINECYAAYKRLGGEESLSSFVSAISEFADVVNKGKGVFK